MWKAAVGFGLGVAGAWQLFEHTPMAAPSTERVDRGKGIAHGIIEAVGNTPLIELPTLSKATGCRILVKVCAFALAACNLWT